MIRLTLAFSLTLLLAACGSDTITGPVKSGSPLQGAEASCNPNVQPC